MSYAPINIAMEPLYPPVVQQCTTSDHLEDVVCAGK